MIDYLTYDLIPRLIGFQWIMLLVLISNIYLLHALRKHENAEHYPMISILVPARDEENNVAACVQSLLAQEYPDFELLVLDDKSQDGTLLVLKQLAHGQPRMRVLVGKPAPEGMAGKVWACSQLAEEARGELLFFTDADTVHHPQVLRTCVAALIGAQADLLTGFPRQEVLTWGERLLVPFFSWASLCFFPLAVAYRLRRPNLAFAVGQMLLFRREAYQKIGGHAALGISIVEDIELARRVHAAGLRWRMTSLSDLITSRMYSGLWNAVDGFTKNLFAAFGFRLLVYAFVFLWLGVLFTIPLVLSTALLVGGASPAQLSELGACLGLSLLLWLISYLELNLPAWLAPVYPLTILANQWVAARSLLHSLTGRLTWKGRRLAGRPWRWF